MTTKQVRVERFSVTSSKSFEEVVAKLEAAVGYGSPEAMKVARDLDSKVEALLIATAA